MEQPVKIVLHPKSENESSSRKDNDLIVDFDQEELNALKDTKVGETIKLHAVIDKWITVRTIQKFKTAVMKPIYLSWMSSLIRKSSNRWSYRKSSRGTKLIIEVTKQKWGT
ncbi:MAG: hypothetical protein R2877_03040 [Bdellovibrionota bacterium]